MATKNTKIFDLNLFSGSSELIRQFFRATYYDSGDGSVEFVSSEEAPPHPIESIIETNFQNSNELNDFTTPTVTYINRIQSFPLTAEDDFASDEEWKRFMVGGEFGSKSYPGIYNERVYADHYNTSSLPYTPKEIINIPKDVIEPSLSLTTEYYNFYSRYQQKTNNVDSELQIPNYYIFEPLEQIFAV